MKQPVFSIETGRDNEIRIVVARPDGTKVVITGGQSKKTRSETERKYLRLASFLESNFRKPVARAPQADMARGDSDFLLMKKDTSNDHRSERDKHADRQR